jgi:DsbC/DsbD-like thiol-disulfide interchange protein
VKLLPVAVAVMTLGQSFLVAQGRPKAEVSPLVDADAVHAGSTFRVALQVSLPDGLHVQSNQPRDPLLIPTALTIEPTAGVTVVEVAYPEPTDFAQAGQQQPLSVFEQRFVIGARLTIDRSVAPGEIVVPVRLRYQACDASTCFAPARQESRWSLPVVPAATAITARSREVFDKIHFRR